MRSIFVLPVVLALVLALGGSPALADFGAPPGGPPGGGPIGGGTVTTPKNTGTTSGGPSVNWGYAAAGTAACVAASAIFDSSVRKDFKSLLVKGVVPCVVATGAVILVSLAGGPAAVGVIVGIIVYGVIRWLVSLFEDDEPELQTTHREVSHNFHDPLGQCDSFSREAYCYTGGR